MAAFTRNFGMGANQGEKVVFRACASRLELNRFTNGRAVANGFHILKN
jgi:hypothetical protein